MNEFLDRDSLVICEVGDSLFGSLDLRVPGGSGRTGFLASAYYSTLGFAVPAALGAQLRNRRRRPLVLVGDGGFQMTGTELSTIARGGLNPIVCVLNNRGYLTERVINEGPYNDIPEWAYHRLPDLLGCGRGWEVRTEGDLDAALRQARAHTAAFSILNIHLDPHDRSDALLRLGEGLAQVASRRRVARR
jgi:indolepyruvate decarboxylase